MQKKYNVAVLGATGLVGENMFSILHDRGFPVDKIYALASSKSHGKTVLFGNKTIDVQDVENFDFKQVDIALFSAGSSVSAKYAPIAANAGCIVIDNTSEFRYDSQVPLVIPEINPLALEQYKTRNIISNPNCSTIQMLVALKPIYDAVGIKKINVATYQSVSGTGKDAVNELVEQGTSLLAGKTTEPKVYTRQIAYNVLPHIDSFQDNGFTKEEMKMHWETQKILNDDKIVVNSTCVRVPVVSGHSEVLHIETFKPLSAIEARRLLESAPGITVLDEPEESLYPTPFTDAIDNDAVFVGRIRNGLDGNNFLNLWVVCDNLRKGAALNSVQIAELLIAKFL